MSDSKLPAEQEAKEIKLLLQKIHLKADEILANLRQMKRDITTSQAARVQRSAFRGEYFSTREIISDRVGHGVFPRFSEQMRSSSNSVSSRDPEIFPWSAQ